MLDSTIKTIYALKQNYLEMAKNGGDKIVAEFWAEYTGTPVEAFNDITLTNLAKGLFLDYLEGTDEPCLAVRSLFNGFPTYSPEEFRNAIWSTLAIVSVKDKYGNFINGFKEVID